MFRFGVTGEERLDFFPGGTMVREEDGHEIAAILIHPQTLFSLLYRVLVRPRPREPCVGPHLGFDGILSIYAFI
jgi:hypothetical protein